MTAVSFRPGSWRWGLSLFTPKVSLKSKKDENSVVEDFEATICRRYQGCCNAVTLLKKKYPPSFNLWYSLLSYTMHLVCCCLCFVYPSIQIFLLIFSYRFLNVCQLLGVACANVLSPSCYSLGVVNGIVFSFRWISKAVSNPFLQAPCLMSHDSCTSFNDGLI